MYSTFWCVRIKVQEKWARSILPSVHHPTEMKMVTTTNDRSPLLPHNTFSSFMFSNWKVISERFRSVDRIKSIHCSRRVPGFLETMGQFSCHSIRAHVVYSLCIAHINIMYRFSLTIFFPNISLSWRIIITLSSNSYCPLSSLQWSSFKFHALYSFCCNSPSTRYWPRRMNILNSCNHLDFRQNA
jgi:hypothetical protein